MIDIIMPAFNAHDTIKSTLASIAMQQNVKDLNVYIIDDCSNKGYEEEYDLFKSVLNIKLCRLDKNMGPGYARQFGIDNSNSEYIIFMDSDDLFYDCFSCINLYYAIESEKYDVLTGRILEINANEEFVWDERFDVLHAKIYRRAFLKQNRISFPSFYNSEDEAFNNLVLINKPKIGSTEDITYVYKRRDDSLTMQNDYFTKKHIKAVCENLEWTINKASKEKKDKIEIAKVIVNSFGYLYYYFYRNMKDKNIKYVYDVIPLYKKYVKYISDDQKREIVVKWVNVFEKYPIDLSFEEFIKRIENSN